MQEPEADTDIRASDGSPGAPGMGNSIATGTGVVVANEGMNELAGNPNFTRADGSHVVLDAPDYTADDSNDEFYGDASSIAAQGTVDYQYSGALPNAGIPADCTFYIKGDAPGASLLDLSDTPYDPSVQTLAQVVSGIDNAVSENADVISESFGATYIPGSPFSVYFEAADNAAVAAGVTVVASSGDSGDSGTVMAPSADPLVISAGAVDNFRLVAMDDGYRGYVSNNMAALSSGGTAPTGKTVDLVAPGWYGGEAACADNSGGCPDYPTESMRGTSEAAPLIAGAAADVIQAYRDTHAGASPTPAMVKDILTSTATDIDSPADQQGGGLLNVYAAVKAAQQLPGSTAGGGASALVASPSQVDVSGDGGSSASQDVSLYNAGGSPVAVTGTYRRIGREFPIGRTVTENVSAPDPSLPVPEAGAAAASPVTFTVPPHLGRLDVDMIWPDPANSGTLQIQLFNPRGALAQESYGDGSPATARRAGSIPNIQHIEVSAPQPGRWTARILWSGKDQDLALPPITPGSYAGPMTFRVAGQDWVTRPVTNRPVIIGAHASASVPLRVRFPVSPGDHPESVQFTGTALGHGQGPGPATASVPVARRTLIPSSGGTFRTLLTSTVGRSIGQVSTYAMAVPSGLSQLTVSFQTADVSADNVIGYYLVDPDGNLVASGSTPDTAAGQAPGTVTLTAPDPVAGTWEIDVELGVTVSGQEFTQTVFGTVSETG